MTEEDAWSGLDLPSPWDHSLDFIARRESCADLQTESYISTCQVTTDHDGGVGGRRVGYGFPNFQVSSEISLLRHTEALSRWYTSVYIQEDVVHKFFGSENLQNEFVSPLLAR